MAVDDSEALEEVEADVTEVSVAIDILLDELARSVVDNTDELPEVVIDMLVSVVWLMIDVALTAALDEASGKSDVTEEMMTVTGPPVTVASLA